MRTLLLIPAALLIANADAAPPLSSEGQAKLDKATVGRLAGEPRPCIPTRSAFRQRIIDEDAILFESRTGELWLNRTRGSCNLDRSSAFKRQTIGSNMCSGEVLIAFDPANGAPRGSCGFGDFVPYAKAEAQRR